MRIADSQVVRDLPLVMDDTPVLETVRTGAPVATHPFYLWQPPPLNERIKAQRGMFVIGEIASNPSVRSYSTLGLELVPSGDEQTRVGKLLDPAVGRYVSEGPPRLVVFRLRGTLRRQLLGVLAKRFGYTTQSIYPDFNGFARANAASTLLNPSY